MSSPYVQIAGAIGTPTYNVDCQRTGQGTLSNKQVMLKKIKGEELIHARVELNVSQDNTLVISIPTLEIFFLCNFMVLLWYFISNDMGMSILFFCYLAFKMY
jgi:hypothetical protein